MYAITEVQVSTTGTDIQITQRMQGKAPKDEREWGESAQGQVEV